MGMFDDLIPSTGGQPRKQGGMFDDLIPRQKERSWVDVPSEALTNIPDSAVQFGKALVSPILHPVETAQQLYNVGYGLASKAAGALGVEQDPEEKARDEATTDAIGKHLRDRFGSAEAVKKTLATDPVGAIADASLVLTGGGAAAARLPGVAGQAGRMTRSVGSAIDPLNAATTGVRAVGTGAANVLGVTSGVGTTPIVKAYEAGKTGNQAFSEHMRGSRQLDEVVDMADAAVKAAQADRGAAYKAGMAETRALQTPLDMAPVGDAYRKAGDALHFQGIVKSEAASAVHDRIGRKIADFMALPPAARTAEAFDALKQSIGEIRMETQPATASRKVADEIYHAVKNEIVRQSPSYAQTMRGYADASDTLGELRKTFSINEKAATDTTLRKLQSVMRNDVSTNYGQRARLAEELARYQPDLLPALAGQALNTWAPRGIARVPAGGAGLYSIANPSTLAMLPAASPRLIGEAAYAAGRVQRALRNAGQASGASRLSEAAARAYRASDAMRAIGVAPPADTPRDRIIRSMSQ
jgi:hypothetical protein